MSIATTANVATWMGADFGPIDNAQVQMWLDALERQIRVRVPDFNQRLLDPDYLSTVRDIELSAVERKLRNMDGFASQSVDNVALSYRSSAASGVLELLDDEWRQLGVNQTVGSLRVTPGEPTRQALPLFEDWPFMAEIERGEVSWPLY